VVQNALTWSMRSSDRLRLSGDKAPLRSAEEIDFGMPLRCNKCKAIALPAKDLKKLPDGWIKKHGLSQAVSVSKSGEVKELGPVIRFPYYLCPCCAALN